LKIKADGIKLEDFEGDTFQFDGRFYATIKNNLETPENTMMVFDLQKQTVIPLNIDRLVHKIEMEIQI
jgi:hypothetical protein